MQQAQFITKAVAEDSDAIARLINSAYQGEPGSRAWTSEGQYMEGQRTAVEDIGRLLNRPGIDNFKYCTESGEITGFVSLEKHDRHIYLGLLSVSPSHQAAGIGRRLLEFGEAYAKENQKEAMLITVINIRHELIAWYERRGYRATGKTIPFPNGGHNAPKVPLHLIEMKKPV